MQGNTLAIYEYDTPSETRPEPTIVLKEIPIQGGSRLGQYKPHYVQNTEGQIVKDKPTALGQRVYEFSNHLQNVLVVIADYKVPQANDQGEVSFKAIVVAANDYYPFGMVMTGRTFSNDEYRYGFNGQEKSDELDDNGNSYTAEYWQYDSRIARRWNVDPVFIEWESSYAVFRNSPITLNDPNGDCSGPNCPDFSYPTVHIYSNVFTQDEHKIVEQAKINLELALFANGHGHIRVVLHKHSSNSLNNLPQNFSGRNALIFVGSNITTMENFSKIDPSFSARLMQGDFKNNKEYPESASGYNLNFQTYPTGERHISPEIKLKTGSRPNDMSMNTSAIMLNRIDAFHKRIDERRRDLYNHSDLLTVVFLHVLGHNAGLPDNMSEGNIMGRYATGFGTVRELPFFTPFNQGLSLQEIVSKDNNSLFYKTLGTYFYPSGSAIDNIIKFRTSLYKNELPFMLHYPIYDLRKYNFLETKPNPIFYFYDDKLFK